MSIAASVAGSVISSSMQEDSAGQASQAQQQGTDLAVEEQRRQFDLNREDLAPFTKVGKSAVNRLSHLLGLGQQGASGIVGSNQYTQYHPDNIRTFIQSLRADKAKYTDPSGASDPVWDKEIADAEAALEDSSSYYSEDPAEFGSLNKKFTLADFWSDPVTQASYQFGLDSGTKALGNMAGARGNRNSGAQLKALTKFGTDYTGGQAAGSSGRFYGDQDRTYNRLAGVAGTGQTATMGGVAMGQNSANTISGLMASQGNARGAAAIAGGNARAGGFQNVGNSIANLVNGRSSGGGSYSPYNDPNQNFGGFGGAYYDTPDFSMSGDWGS